MNEMEMKKMALELAGIEPTAENIEYAERHGWLTINTGRDGRKYAWYLDTDGKEACVDQDGNELSKDIIEIMF